MGSNDAGRERARRDAARDAVAGARGGPSRRRSAPEMPAPETLLSAPRSRVHAVLTALPILMLVAGLWVHYSGERAQSGGAPIRAESVELDARFEGFSRVGGGHYLWFEQDGRRRGARLRDAQRAALAGLEHGEPIALGLAPTVAGSKTLWVWYVARADEGGRATPLLDESGRLR